ncbi:MAG: hypothetical protein GXO90_07165, partial [FCB group bacterium]|nr:hypothetical protein [FCB group bacterium]
MNKIIVLLTIFWSSILFGQVNQNTLRYYPLDIGNFWQFHTEMWSYYPDPYYEDYYFNLEIIKDTIMVNQNLYYQFKKAKYREEDVYTTYSYERVDTLTGNVYRYFPDSILTNNTHECLIDSLASSLGDSSKSSRYFWNQSEYNYLTVCQYVYPDSVLGVFDTSKYFQDMTIPPNIVNYKLFKNIGFISRYEVEEGANDLTSLCYALIDNIEYGTRQELNVINSNLVPNTIELSQNYPNPFNSRTCIKYFLAEQSS